MTSVSISNQALSTNSPEQEKQFADLPVRILRLKQVVERTGLSRSTIYDRIDPKSRRYDATFPKPIKLSGNKDGTGAVGWLESAVNKWIRQRCQLPVQQPST